MHAVLAVLLMTWGGVALAAPRGCYETPWFSEEGDGLASCQAGFAVRGIRCSGEHCDNKQLTCCPLPPSLASGGSEWGGWFSEEGAGSSHDSALVGGLRCSNSYCDNLMISWTQTRVPVTRACTLSDWISSESSDGGLGMCPGRTFVAGLSCRDAYCGALQLRCCMPGETTTDPAVEQARTQQAAGDLLGARQTLRELLKASPGHAEATALLETIQAALIAQAEQLYAEGRQLVAQNQQERALSALQQVIVLVGDPQHPLSVSAQQALTQILR